MAAKPVIALATTNEAIVACYLVLVALRSHLVTASFVDRSRRQMAYGYQVAVV